MTEQHKPDSNTPKTESHKERLTHAYDTMLERTRESLTKLSEQAKPHLEPLLDKAKTHAVSLGELSESEAAQISESLHRDLEEATEFLKDAKRELGDWLYFDYKLVQEKCWNIFNEVLHHCKAEWHEVKTKTKSRKEYHSGEIVGFGSFECVNCQEPIHFTKTSELAACVKCQGKKFYRQQKLP